MNFKFQISNFKFLTPLLFLLYPRPVYADVDLSGVYAFGSVKSLGDLISYLVPTAFTIAGIMFVFYFLTACFEFVNSQGDKNAINAARQKIAHSIIGLLLLLLGFVLVQYLPTAFGLKGMTGIFSP